MNALEVYTICSRIKDQFLYEDPAEQDVIGQLNILISMAQNEMNLNELRKNKTLLKFKAFERVLRRSTKDSRECLRYAYIHQDGLQYVCDFLCF